MIAPADLTICVTGPVHKYGLQAIPNYLKSGRVTVSSWTNDPNLKLLLEQDYLPQIKVVLNQWPAGLRYYDRDNPIMDNDGNSGAQCLSVLGGLRNVETDYVIRVRADESWGNLQPFIDMMATGKVVSNCRYARRRGSPFHIGDTMYGGRTSVILPAFVELKRALEAHEFHTMVTMGATRVFSAEQKICVSILKVLEPGFDFNECVAVMRKYFLICPCNAMAPFIINSSGWLKDFGYDGKTSWNPRAENCIDSIDQV